MKKSSKRATPRKGVKSTTGSKAARKTSSKAAPPPAMRKPPIARRKKPALPVIREVFSGRHLKLMDRNGWEYAERRMVTGVVTIVAVTSEGRLILTEQFRPPVGARVIELPAGLAGDIAGAEDEELATAAARELHEETGYRAERIELIARGPSSAGLTSEVINFFRAADAHPDGKGGGDETEDITVHVVPLATIDAWLKKKERAGLLIDPKIYAGIHLLSAR